MDRLNDKKDSSYADSMSAESSKRTHANALIDRLNGRKDISNDETSSDVERSSQVQNSQASSETNGEALVNILISREDSRSRDIIASEDVSLSMEVSTSKEQSDGINGKEIFYSMNLVEHLDTLARNSMEFLFNPPNELQRNQLCEKWDYTCG